MLSWGSLLDEQYGLIKLIRCHEPCITYKALILAACDLIRLHYGDSSLPSAKVPILQHENIFEQ